MRSLICITTAARSFALRAVVWNYLKFCLNRPDYDFLVSLDGQDQPTIDFCDRFRIPLLYSQTREGVGLSKNRVLKSYPHYTDYFFIEDDAFLLDAEIFEIHRAVARELSLHHLSLGPEDRFVGSNLALGSSHGPIVGTDFGSAQFNYFSRQGICAVGGFHPMFAKYCRFGHTEHSYRFVNSGLAPKPFMRIAKCGRGYLKLYSPRSVTKVSIAKTGDRLSAPEAELISERLSNFPLTTLGNYAVPQEVDLRSKAYSITSYRHLYEFGFRFSMTALNLARYGRSIIRGILTGSRE